MGRLVGLHEKYKGAAFAFVAIRDAGHPDPDAPEISPPEDDTPAARRESIRDGMRAYKMPFTGLLDEDEETERAYNAYPKRLVVVGADGLIVYDGGWGDMGGPSDWDLDEVEAKVRAAIASGPRRD